MADLALPPVPPSKTKLERTTSESAPLIERIKNRLPVFARLAGKKSLLITGTVAAVSYASRFFDWGVKALDWAQRADFLRLRQARILSILQLFVSPTGADFIFFLAIIAFLIAVILAVNPKPKPATAAAAIEPALREAVEPETKLTFEIDVKDSQVHVGGGNREIRQIEARIKLRCFKHVEGPASVQSLHMSLLRYDSGGGEVPLISVERKQTVLDCRTTEEISMRNGWTIEQPVSDYRWFIFEIDITPLVQASISGGHFLRLIVNPTGQDTTWQDIRVDSWDDARTSNSSIKLRSNHEGNAEIERLQGEIEGLNNELIEVCEDFEEQIKQLESQNRDLTRANTSLEKDLFNEKRSKELLETSWNLSRREVSEVKASLNQATDELAGAKQQIQDFKWLVRIAESEEQNIDAAVMVLSCEMFPKMDEASPYINFKFCVLNMSVFQVFINDSIDGWIEFSGNRLGGSLKMVDNKATNCSHRQGAWFVVRQWVSKEDVAMICGSNEQCAFSFEHLEVTVKGNDKFPEDAKVAEQRLTIKWRIERTGKAFEKL